MATDHKDGTQNTQYDKIGTKYNNIKKLPSAEPEEPSSIKALGNIEGKTCLGMCHHTNTQHDLPNTHLTPSIRPRLRDW